MTRSRNSAEKEMRARLPPTWQGGRSSSSHGSAEGRRVATRRSRSTIRIGMLTAGDPSSADQWSGIPLHMSRSLQQHCGEVFPLGPLPRVDFTAGRLLDQASQRLLGKRYLWEHSVRASLAYATAIRERLARVRPDVVFAPAASVELAFLQTDLPVVYLSDATFSLLENYYPWFSDLLGVSRLEGRLLETRAIREARLLVYPTDWAAQSAVADHGADPSRVHIIPFGANLDQIPSREEALSKERSSSCQLLFVGKSWERKGGPVALETLYALRKAGVDARLTFCGCEPPEPVADPAVRVIPFLDKREEDQRRLFEQLFAAADFFLLPTQQECFGVVFAEANAYGVPAVTRDTGGVADVVRSGQNGIVLFPAARGPEYAAAIAGIWRDQDRYAALRRTSRDAFESRLNWDCWGIAVSRLLERI